MATSTPVYAWPLPAGTDTGDVPYWMNQTVTAIENTVNSNNNNITGAWASFTPTIVGTAAPSMDCRYKMMGKTVFYRVEITLTAALTAALTFTLPVARRLQGTESANGVVYAKDISAGVYIQGRAVQSGTSATVTRVMLSASGTNPNMTDASASAPIVWASGDTLSITGEYEAA